MGCLLAVPVYNPDDFTDKIDEENNNLIEPLNANEEEEERLLLEQQSVMKEVAKLVAKETDDSEVDSYIDPEIRAASAPNSIKKIPPKSPKELEFDAEQQRLAQAKKIENDLDELVSASCEPPNSEVTIPQHLSYSGYVKETQKRAQSEKMALVDSESVISGIVNNENEDNASIVSDLTSVMSENVGNDGGSNQHTAGSSNAGSKKGKNKNKNKNKGKK